MEVKEIRNIKIEKDNIISLSNSNRKSPGQDNNINVNPYKSMIYEQLNSENFDDYSHDLEKNELYSNIESLEDARLNFNTNLIGHKYNLQQNTTENILCNSIIDKKPNTLKCKNLFSYQLKATTDKNIKTNNNQTQNTIKTIKIYSPAKTSTLDRVKLNKKVLNFSKSNDKKDNEYNTNGNSLKYSKSPSSKSINTYNNKKVISRSVSNGQRMYMKTKALQDGYNKKITLEKIKQDQKIKQNCSFKPKLNDYSMFLIMRKQRDSNSKNNGNSSNINTNDNYVPRSYSYGKLQTNYPSSLSIIKKNNFDYNSRTNRNKQKINLNANAEDISTFHSTNKIKTKETNNINPIKRRTIQEINDSSLKLYNDHEVLKLKQQQLRENFYTNTCPFQPNLITDPSFYLNKESQQLHFFQRLQNWVDKRNEKYIVDMEQAFYDHKTGLRLFSPQMIATNMVKSNSSKVKI